MAVAHETLYLNSDRTRVVREDDPDASFLLARAGAEIDPALAAQYGITGDDVPLYDAVADHAEKHGGETDAEAERRRQLMLAGHPDPDGPPAENERGETDTKASTHRSTKAVSRAPENKAAPTEE